jgi:hypothetical protein
VLTTPVFWRSMLPLFAYFLCLFALTIVRSRISPPQRAFLVTIWGSTALLVINAGVTAALLWASETPPQMRQNAQFNVLLGASAGIMFALGIGLGWLTRVQSERFLIAIFRPPPGVTYLLRGWLWLPLLLLWPALCFGAFAATYGILSYLDLSH